MNKITSIFVTAKCSDLCAVSYRDIDGNIVAQTDGYVPEFMPEEHYGDYVELEIDIATGKILNWTKPTQASLKRAIAKG